MAQMWHSSVIFVDVGYNPPKSYFHLIMITRFSYVSLYIFVHAMFCIVFLVPFFLSSGVVFVARWSQNIAKSYFFGILIILYPFDDILPHLASQHHVMGGTSEWGKGGR